MAKKITDRKINEELNKGFNQVKEATKNANDFVYNTSEDVVNFTLKRSTEWQGVTEKALKGGLKLAANQQDLIFDTLETIKDQFQGGRKRFKALFSKN